MKYEIKKYFLNEVDNIYKIFQSHIVKAGILNIL